MAFLDLAPAMHAAGTVRLPGSKSISNRFLLLAALAEGETEIRDLLRSDDVELMLDALRLLGVEWTRCGETRDFRVRGAGGAFPVKQADLFLGNAGTAVRSLTAALAFSGGDYAVRGVPRMHERPIGDLVDALRQAGCAIRYDGNAGFPPLHIGPGAVRPGARVAVRGEASSQFLTALLMALPLTGAGATVEVVGELISKPYIDITLNLMARFGVVVERDGWRQFRIPAGACYRSPGRVFVEGDASSASYFLAAGAVAGGPVRVEGVGCDSIQGDVRFAEALQAMGARVAMGANWIEARSPAVGRLRGVDLDLNHIPDAAMTLAVVALYAEGATTLRNIASWRVKETDRIAAMAAELRKLGATVEAGTDFLRVTPPTGPLNAGVAIDTYDDHRVAMCFSLACLAGVPLRINDPHCVAKTFPDYFERFLGLLGPVPVIAIDGPAASGKGTVAARLAHALGYHYLDSGALYRLVALAAARAGVALDDAAALARLAAALPATFQDDRVLLDGEDVSLALRSEASGAGASQVAALPAVREALLRRQRAFRAAPGLVAEGRDMGSVVFPDAVLKVYLTASAETRAERRHKQLIEKGMSASMATLLQDLRQRDARDSARAAAPLRKCADAVPLDTTRMTVDEAVMLVRDLATARLQAAAPMPQDAAGEA